MSAPTSNPSSNIITTANPSGLAEDKDTNTAPEISRTLEADLTLLTQLLSGTGGESAEEGEDVVELLRRLEAAENVADGMEERLDGIMDSLDDLLNDLEARAAGGVGAQGEESAVVVVEEEEIEIVAVPETGADAVAGKEEK
ncbi:hypothetical protein L226DRAFT_565444 [Lentinus tigrinus ALCF2SS1-7]|uniref:Uncharacterized protein n=1 Tax=Lentinus tigrinus ALCF2SS1-6 TaxID=1328759 RepID=A0A5C2ST99_9APHY|nr:hypothetical protein L227DRAFT_607220 [Lentinus tigrinus ALCF2SS1-6]RPD82941.1 hypothetical protein L226DRAFT_565444 [Lentinus tigrinus ALCF2SS1-7]